MGDLTTSTCAASLTCQLVRFNPYAAKLKQIKGHHYFMAAQKSYNALPLSFTKNFECKHARTHMLARRAFSGLQAEYEGAEKAENPMQNETGGEGEANDKTQNASSAEEFLLMMAAHSDRDHHVASSGAEMIANFASDTSQTENTADAEIVHAHTDYNTYTFSAACEERVMNRKAQQLTYLFAALASSVGITSLAGASVYYRFSWQMEGGEVPWTEMLGTFSLALGAAVGMEYWARWAHRALWHASLWSMHESHHRPRDGPFELNDVFAIINAIPAIGLMAFGFLHKGLVPGLCFGAGLGITIFGIAYMFVHDGLVHRRFPVGPIADVPYFQKVAAAHQLHHADKFNGVPYGLFLGPTELEEVGGRAELEKVLQKRKREKTNPING